MLETISRPDATAKGLTRYYTGYSCKHGHIAERLVSTRACVACMAKHNNAWSKTNRSELNDRQNIYRKANRERVNTAHRDWAANNRESLRSSAKRWREANPQKRAAYEAKRRAAKLGATLPGYDKEIMKIYEVCPAGMEVDHIFPLQGENSCGLHVPWNLQYLTPLANQEKGNRLPTSSPLKS